MGDCNEKVNIESYRSQAEAGNPVEQFRMGLIYYYGNGVDQNYKNAVKWFVKAAEQGYLYARTSLGICYRRGEGILVNYIEAVKLFTLAAGQGDIVAIYNLGICYYNGQGVSQDYQKAADLFQKAADQGNISERHSFGQIKSDIADEPVSADEAFRLYREASVKIDNLNAQLKDAILRKDGAAFQSDANIMKINNLSREINELKKTEGQLRLDKSNLERQLNEQRKKYEKQLSTQQSEAKTLEFTLRKKIKALESQCSEQISMLDTTRASLQTSKQEVNRHLHTIEEHMGTIVENQLTIDGLNTKLSACEIQITENKKVIEANTNTITELRTQKPFIKKANVLCWIDIFALIVICVVFIRNGMYYRVEQPYIWQSFAAGIIVTEILLLICLNKKLYVLHFILCLVMYGGTYLFWLEYYIFYEMDHIALIPYGALLLWSAFASLRKEIYITHTSN